MDIEDSELLVKQVSKSVTFLAVVMDRSPTQKLSHAVARTLQSVL